MFRRVSGVLFPIVVIFTSVAAAMGIGGRFGYPSTIDLDQPQIPWRSRSLMQCIFWCISERSIKGPPKTSARYSSTRITYPPC